MTITQQRASHRATFSFEDEGLRYSIKDPSGATSFFVSYEEIPNEHVDIEERRVWFKNVGLLWVIIGIVQVGLRIAENGKIGVPFWLLLGIGCIGYYYYSSTKFLGFDTPRGRVFVIDDNKKDPILGEFVSRRNAQLKRRYARVIDASQPDREATRFNFLLHEKIITQDEFDELMVELRLGIADNMQRDEERA